ncbi:Aste57867_8565 [Aphanomyces stellatus]|uniref:RecQ-mediated genome instability protein 1 n=1 Tax=Aphanomyces stellatus TaxID=120398 RepID=A0A485KKK3_9STRA|nr:hypothetical protein As57867_008533 [Aphanomyces stellatus]VFT85451.1 Aste57867_8565 [Aphanomyces stellatus]
MDACRQIAEVRDTWVTQCEGQLQALMRSMGRTLPRDEQDEFVMQQFLFADIQTSCAPSLPTNLHEMHRVVLQGRYFLQIVEVSNIGAGHEQRQEDTPNRMLKFCFTDGSTLAYAIEHKLLNNLSATTPRGTKVVVENVHIRHGLLLLTSAVVLGASGNNALETLGTEAASAASIAPAVATTIAPPAALPRTQHAPPPPRPIPTAQGPPPRTAAEIAAEAALSDEERSTDPSIRPLFYDHSTAAVQRRRKKKAAPGSPFTYLAHVQPQSTHVLKAFVKSVASFEFASGTYDLKVYIEDGTRAILVAVDPKFVATLMGVSCDVFVRAMQTNVPQGMQWVTKMQNELSTLEGLMTVHFHATMPPVLASCDDIALSTCAALVSRLSN